MKNYDNLLFFVAFFCSTILFAQQTLQSPNKQFEWGFELTKKKMPTYLLNLKGKPVVKTSNLGFDQVLVEEWNTGWEDWYVESKNYGFDFLSKGKKYTAKIYNDTKDSYYKTNPKSYNIKEILVTKGYKLSQYSALGGGYAISSTSIR